MSKSVVKKLTCRERDTYLIPAGTAQYEGWSVESSVTDLYGEFGAPFVQTTWVKCGVRVQDNRHPSVLAGVSDVEPCEHYYWEGSDDDDDEGDTMSEEETIKRLWAEHEAAYKTYREALGVWEPARDVERAAKRALVAADALWKKSDMDLYRLTKEKGTQ